MAFIYYISHSYANVKQNPIRCLFFNYSPKDRRIFRGQNMKIAIENNYSTLLN